MKNSKYLLIQITMLTVYFSIVAACTKDQKPTVYGTWETVSAFGTKWEYSLVKEGQFCKKAPEYFPDTSFCFDYSVTDNKVVVDAPDDETWVWEFVCEDVADVTVTYIDGSIQRFILKRIE